MPDPSWMTTTPGHGGSVSGSETKYGSAMSAMDHARTTLGAATGRDSVEVGGAVPDAGHWRTAGQRCPAHRRSGGRRAHSSGRSDQFGRLRRSDGLTVHERSTSG